MKKVLVISGHTDLATSVANKTILDTIGQYLPETEIVKLDTLYPDFKIDVDAEQQRLLKADIIVLQFPIFWYSAPSILERWMEETFRHGFSHGSTGNKLKGKKMILSFTTGAPQEMYSHKGAMWGIRLKSSYLATKPHVIFAKWNLRDISILVA